MPPPLLNNICILTWHLSHCQIFEHLMCANFVKLLLIVDHMWWWWGRGWWCITCNIRTDFELVIMTRSIIRRVPPKADIPMHRLFDRRRWLTDILYMAIVIIIIRVSWLPFDSESSQIVETHCYWLDWYCKNYNIYGNVWNGFENYLSYKLHSLKMRWRLRNAICLFCKWGFALTFSETDYLKSNFTWLLTSDVVM